MKVYTGERLDEGGARVTVGEEGRGRAPLDPRFDIRKHSPTGFAWGYAGSGPAQLALAICADVLGDDERAQRVYQYFKDRVIAPLDDDTWTLTEDFVRQAIDEIEAAIVQRDRA